MEEAAQTTKLEYTRKVELRIPLRLAFLFCVLLGSQSKTEKAGGGEVVPQNKTEETFDAPDRFRRGAVFGSRLGVVVGCHKEEMPKNLLNRGNLPKKGNATVGPLFFPLLGAGPVLDTRSSSWTARSRNHGLSNVAPTIAPADASLGWEEDKNSPAEWG